MAVLMQPEPTAERLIYAALAESKILREYKDAFRKATGASLRLVPAGGLSSASSHWDRRIHSVLWLPARGWDARSAARMNAARCEAPHESSVPNRAIALRA